MNRISNQEYLDRTQGPNGRVADLVKIEAWLMKARAAIEARLATTTATTGGRP